MAKNKLYIAYGSNLNVRQMEGRCPAAAVAGASELKNHRLLFKGGNGMSIATVEPFKGGSVPVLVWKITPADEAALDIYEGWPHLYRKATLRVQLNGKAVGAMIYILNDGKPLGSPSPNYYRTIWEGYQDAGFDHNILNQAADNSATDMPILTAVMLDQIFTIRGSGETNMFDTATVREIALREGFDELAAFIAKDKRKYAKFIFTGRTD